MNSKTPGQLMARESAEAMGVFCATARQPVAAVGLARARGSSDAAASDSLPVGVVDALEAGLVAMALDEARVTGQMIDLSATWAEFDAYGLRA